MQFSLPTSNFSFIKIVVSLPVLFFLFSYNFYLSFLAAFFINSHVFGAWYSVWRSKRAKSIYYFWIILLFMFVYELSFNFLSASVLIFVTHVLFTFHFLYDEFDLQEEKRNITNIISSLGPTVLILILLIKDFLSLNIGMNIFVIVALMFLAVELIFLKEINWFFVGTKILVVMFFYSLYLGSSISIFFSGILVYHYLFWFIYPVYKLNKKQADVLSFVYGLLCIVFLFGFVYFYLWDHSSIMFIRYFQMVSIMHIITMPPFGYIFGLSKR